MKNSKLNTVLAATIACAASTTMSVADGPGAGCVSHQQCWDDHICHGLVFCFTSPVFPDQQSRVDCFDDGSGNGIVAAYNDCMKNVCKDRWSRGGISVNRIPTSNECQQLYESLLAICYSGIQNFPFNCNQIDPASLAPTAEQLQLMKKYCAHAARMELNHCLKADEGDSDTGDGSFQNSLFIEGAAVTAEFAPQEGVDTASWIKVPGVDEDIMINGVVTRAMLWTEDGWAWSTIHESGEDPDGLVSVNLAVCDIAGVSGLDYVEIVISWMSDEEVVHVTPIRLDFAEGGSAADFDRNGVVSVDDLAAFLDAFSQNAPRADFNMDGFVNSEDLSAFIAAFDAN